MPQPRFYFPGHLDPDTRITLPDNTARHAVTVLRLGHGDPVVLFNGDGHDYGGILERQGKHATVRVLDKTEVDRESGLDVTLVQGISSGERMDFTVQKSVELGVTRIQPVLMRRTVVRLDEDKRRKRLQHWQGVVQAACEQCGRNRLPRVLPILEFDPWLISARAEAGTKLLLDPTGTQRVRDMASQPGPLWLVAGPEGGLDPTERANLLAEGFIPLRLGPRILRTETAAMAALAVLQGVWGDY